METDNGDLGSKAVYTVASNMEVGDYVFRESQDEDGIGEFLFVAEITGTHILRVKMRYRNGFRVEEFLRKQAVFIKDTTPKLRDEYGTPITMMLQMQAVYAVPNHGQMPEHFANQVFYKWQLINEKNVDSLAQLQFDVVEAERFAKHNNLKIVKEHPMDLERKR